MDRQKFIGLSNSLENLLFPPGKYTAAQLINLTPFFHGTLTLDKYKELMLKTFEMQDQERLWWVIKAQYGEVDAKVLLVVLMLQLIGRQKRELGGFNEASRNISANSGSSRQMNSPRNRQSRALYISNQQILILNFIKDHLVNFLKLLPNQPPNTEDPFISAQELQPLSILFKVDRKKPFAQYLPIFNNTQKLKASTISEHLSPRIIISQNELLSLEGLSFSVMIKEQVQCRGKDLKIIGCYDSQIFIESSVRSVYIVGCSNSNIYVASCEKIAFIDKCEKVSLTITTNLLRICNTLDSQFYYYGTSPIILTGDNRNLQLGPNNSNSAQLKTQLKAANIPISNQYLTSFQNVLCKSQTNCYEKMKPSDYDLIVLPIKQDEEHNEGRNNQTAKNKDGVILAPEQYLRQLEDRNKYYSDLKMKIAKSNLNPQMMKHLQSVYQGHFKDWLINKGYNKNLIDLVKMIDKK